MGFLIVDTNDDVVGQDAAFFACRKLIVHSYRIDRLIRRGNGAAEQNQVRLQAGVIDAAINCLGLHVPGALTKLPVPELANEK